jgi:4-amino-4-deoxy-L-arabinose transferase-like glycosyltransferase
MQPSGLKGAARRQWLEPVVLALLTGVALLLRLAFLDRLPPGLYHDEAYNGLDALHVLQGYTPLFFEANHGREPLFIYLTAIGVALWGRSPGALRVVSALLGTLTIPATYWLGKELFGRRVGLLAAGWAVALVWTLNLSRVAFRVVSMPLILALALACLWRARALRSQVLVIGAGVLYGLSFYTYLAARFTPIALALFVAYLALWRREELWPRGWLLFGAASLLSAAPLAFYFATHWSETLGRAGQVSIFNEAINRGDLWGTLLRHAGGALGAFVWRGDFIPRHNIPLRPIFDPLTGGLFCVGLYMACRRFRQAACGFILVWLGTMLLPTILAEDAPHMLRGAGILPVVLFFPALGLSGVVDLLNRAGRQSVSQRSQRVVTLSAAKGLRYHEQGPLVDAAAPDIERCENCASAMNVGSGVGASLKLAPTMRQWPGRALMSLAIVIPSFLGTWSYYRHLRSEAVYYNFEAGATELAVEVNVFLGGGWQGSGLSAPQTPANAHRQAYIAPRLWRDWASVRYLCPESNNLHLLDEGNLQADPITAADALLALWPFEDNTAALALLPPGRLISVREGAQERGDLEQESRLLYYMVWAQVAPAYPEQVQARWANGIELLGFDLEQAAEDQLQVVLFWRTTQTVDNDYQVFVHVFCDGVRLGQHDGPAALGYYPTSRWRPGDVVRDQHLVPLTAPFVEDRCEIQVGLYRWETMQRLAVTDAAGRALPETSVTLR